MIEVEGARRPRNDKTLELTTMLPSLEIARAQVRALETDAERARVRHAIPARRRRRLIRRHSR